MTCNNHQNIGIWLTIFNSDLQIVSVRDTFFCLSTENLPRLYHAGLSHKFRKGHICHLGKCFIVKVRKKGKLNFGKPLELQKNLQTVSYNSIAVLQIHTLVKAMLLRLCIFRLDGRVFFIQRVSTSNSINTGWYNLVNGLKSVIKILKYVNMKVCMYNHSVFVTFK